MRDTYEPEVDARRFQISNYDPGQCARIQASVELFHQAGGIKAVRARNVALTKLLIDQIQGLPNLKIMTPLNDEHRGSHISIQIDNTDMKEFKSKMGEKGVLGDLRRFKDDSYLMRSAPIGLYNNVSDIEKVSGALKDILTKK